MSYLIKDEFKRAVVDGGMELLQQGLTVGTWGNLSVKDPETGLVYIKPSGMPYTSITPQDIVVMDERGAIVDGHRKPSIEFHLHLSIMRARSDVFAVIHTHPIYSSVFGVLREDIPAISEDFAQIVGDRASCCVYALPGTEELAKNVVVSLGEGKAVLIPNHGTVCVGHTLDEAMKVAAVVEKTAHIYLLARSIGTPHVLPHEDIVVMQDFMRNSYGQGK
ncbi:Ribulose-5-phosphate 4-epimerase-like epimerase or aldolase [uncultured spirochete]|jgi:L-fuculose-phosphate aldolase|uniref:Ribulose-5-phosphate 4-epimerase-like epimerase or aldolase n=1 Tax=uncultured spirochete TaxID=156406 RepID=A0A3P3XTH7_9SPIR|nr:Ribulose-5-phosphate 4-epimerase-like epimerase or aldolase [uncultured spirochete]